MKIKANKKRQNYINYELKPKLIIQKDIGNFDIDGHKNDQRTNNYIRKRPLSHINQHNTYFNYLKVYNKINLILKVLTLKRRISIQ